MIFCERIWLISQGEDVKSRSSGDRRLDYRGWDAKGRIRERS